jgi:hypothetical protein
MSRQQTVQRALSTPQSSIKQFSQFLVQHAVIEPLRFPNPPRQRPVVADFVYMQNRLSRVISDSQRRDCTVQLRNLCLKQFIV